MALALGGMVSAATYYVSTSGSDNNSGLDPASAWRTVSKVNTSTFAPGSQILFERGDEWRERLVASSSGAAGSPIVFDAYGSGAKPRFWGSDVLNNAAFVPVAGSSTTFALSTPVEMNSVLINHQFTRSAQLITKSSDSLTNINYVKANPNTWYFNGGQLYLNTNGVNPNSDARVYSAAVREDVVDSNHKNHLVFRNLVVDETAKFTAGYAFRIHFSNDVVVEASEAYRAGKHHFGVINTSNFVGKNLHAELSMPDQGFGGASPYVSYSGDGRADNSTWLNVVAKNPDGMYPGFVSHGAGLTDLVIRNMINRGGGGIFVANESATGKVLIDRGSVENGPVDIFGNNVTVDGITVTGAMGSISIQGDNNLLQNSLVIGRENNWWGGRKASVIESGIGNTIRFNTVIPGPNAGGGGAAIAVNTASSNASIYGNVLGGPWGMFLYDGAAPINANHNFFEADSVFGIMQADGQVSYHTLDGWRQMGYDINSLMESIAFADATDGDYSLLPPSEGLNFFGDRSRYPATDLRGLPRLDSAADMGAFERLLLGDATFDGRIDADDYALIDQAIGTRNANAGYLNGDFNLSGGIPDSDDYFIIDHAFAQQWARLNLGFLGPSAAIPEPSMLLMIFAPAALLMRRRRPN
jgi:hypothetical protein